MREFDDGTLCFTRGLKLGYDACLGNGIAYDAYGDGYEHGDKHPRGGYAT